MVYNFIVKISMYAKFSILMILGLLSSPFAQADTQQDIEELCRFSEEFAVKTLRHRIFLNETLDSQMKTVPSTSKSVTVNNHFLETVKMAHKEKISSKASNSQKLDKAIAFGEKRYQDCLVVMQQVEREIKKYQKDGGLVNVIAECDYGCSIKDISIDTPMYVTANIRSNSMVELITPVAFPTHGYHLHAKLSNGKYCSAPITIDPSKHTNIFAFNSSSCYLYRVQ